MRRGEVFLKVIGVRIAVDRVKLDMPGFRRETVSGDTCEKKDEKKSDRADDDGANLDAILDHPAVGGLFLLAFYFRLFIL